MDQSSALVSVIVRTKDRPHLLECAVASVVAQHYRPLELVVVNDGGEDVEPLLRSLLTDANDIQLQYMMSDVSMGRSAAANVGLQAASGTLGIFLDDDDYFDSEHLSELVAFYTSIQSTSLIAVHNQAKAVKGLIGEPVTHLSTEGAALEKNQIFYANTLPILTVLFPLSIRGKGIAFDEKLDLFEDWDFWLQVHHVCEFHFLEKARCSYRIHESSSGVRDQDNQLAAFQTIYKKWLPQLDQTVVLDMLCRSHRLRAEQSHRLHAEHSQLLAEHQAKSTNTHASTSLLYRLARYAYRKLFCK